ncbi:helix-turn-helix domain-containing protein [Candidatus Formimonas warabiya]|uniref:DNA-binding protein n=1 Tax=Formimonas warabiya TaxID=1761012 RepID=A0A3G1KW26_FORW1|nr:helix-turn-helix domain-containing protein [Candidatus Formimonas warabiya]ATW26674.1 DNA-binding protein [Candidatus Formimonas warabiya]
MELMSAKQAAKIWGISPRRVAILCSEGRIPDAQMVGRSWVIPANAEKPADARVKSKRYIKRKEANGSGRDHGREE